MSKWFTPPELAELLGTDDKKILGWIHSGELSAVNVAASTSTRPLWRISQEFLDTFLESRRNRPIEKRPKKYAPPAKVIKFYQ